MRHWERSRSSGYPEDAGLVLLIHMGCISLDLVGYPKAVGFF